MAEEEAAELLRLARAAPCDAVESARNPVVTPHEVLLDRGAWRAGPLQAMVQPIVEQRLLPYLREELGCEDLALSQVLIRRYVPGQRRTHKLHFDHNALGTAVADLTPRARSGLFVGFGADAGTQFFVPFGGAGDVAVHGWDVAHGVCVDGAHARVSLIVWVKSAADVEQGTTSWFASEATKRNPDAAYRLGLEAEEAEDPWGAATHLRAAADAGHVLAMHRLSRLLRRLDDPAGASRWLMCAACASLPAAKVDMGDEAQSGGDSEGARSMYEAAAEQGDGRAMARMGAMHVRGAGVAADPPRGLQYLRRATESGWSDAEEIRQLLELASMAGHSDAELIALLEGAELTANRP